MKYQHAEKENIKHIKQREEEERLKNEQERLKVKEQKLRIQVQEGKLEAQNNAKQNKQEISAINLKIDALISAHRNQIHEFAAIGRNVNNSTNSIVREA